MEQAEAGLFHGKVVVEDAGDAQHKQAEDEDDEDHGLVRHLPADVHAHAHRHQEVDAGQAAQAAHGCEDVRLPLAPLYRQIFFLLLPIHG